MKKEELKKLIGSEDISIVEAMKMIDDNSLGLIYIADNSTQKLVGCLTDGDIRRYIIKNGNLNSIAKDAMNHKPIFIKQNEVKYALKTMREENVFSVAVVDEYGMICDALFMEEYLKNRQENGNDIHVLEHTPVIVMAGGKGTRLYPYTRILPKPLIPIGDVPILERIINRMSSYGVEDIYLTVNYKKEMIKSYFAESDHPYRIHYINEERPMGTAGSISLIEEHFVKPVIVTNCDILIEADYGNMMRHHLESGNDITIVSSLKNTVIPYGVLHSETEGLITSIEEKPQITHLINTGMYIINPDFFEWIPSDSVFHMTDLVELMINKGQRVGMYPISENAFLDMGEFEEMKRMEERLLQDHHDFNNQHRNHLNEEGKYGE